MDLKGALIRLYNRPGARFAAHVLFWTMYFALNYYLGIISLGETTTELAYLVPVKNTITSAAIFYFLLYLAWPFWTSKRYLVAILLLLISVVLYALLDHMLERMLILSCSSCVEHLKIYEPNFIRFMSQNPERVLAARIFSLGVLYQMFTFLALPLGIKGVLEFYRQRVRALQLRNENIQLEFNFLKSQVQPHFLFNSLNNIHSLILQDRKEASLEVLSKLSSFLRYTLYETNATSNKIEDELNVMKDYVALEQIRLNNTLVNLSADIDSPGFPLPPLLFMPVLENAFKFCRETKGSPSWISVRLELKSGKLYFTCSNSKDVTSGDMNGGGIGLANLRKRLEQHYPRNHNINIVEDEMSYKITVIINAEHD